jgi:biopolymer transport protein ExbB
MSITDKIFLIAQHGAESILWLLLFLSVLSVGLIFERFFALRSVRVASDKTKERIREVLQSNNLGDIEEISKDRDTLEGRALMYGLRHVKEKGISGLEEIFNTYALIERPILERYLNFLATIGANAPFIGLLGTVLGIMKAFNDLALNQTADNRVVMAGIAEALVSTAVGLVVAIPAVMAFNYFQKQVKGALQSLDSVREICIAYAKGRGV